METASPAAAAAPWLVPAVVVLVVAGVALIAAGLAAATRPAPHSWRSFPDDDLPDFALSPPGSRDASPAATTGPARGATTRTGRPLAVAGVVALVAAVALTVAAAGRTGRAQASAGTETARLRFGGVVLEQRAVGVTVAYPDVTVRVGPRRAVAQVRLPTFNCLADAPPADPLAAGCVRSLEEFADLTTPELSVVRGATGALRLSGRFPTYTRPNGSPPEYTGRVYALTVTAHPSGARRGAATPAQGEFRLGTGRTTTAGSGVSVFRFGG